MPPPAPCSFCGDPADPRFREVLAWEQLRTSGGANKMVARHPTGRMICLRCMEDLRAGLQPNSPRLFGRQ